MQRKVVSILENIRILYLCKNYVIYLTMTQQYNQNIGMKFYNRTNYQKAQEITITK